jgi:hypothetical protein
MSFLLFARAADEAFKIFETMQRPTAHRPSERLHNGHLRARYAQSTVSGIELQR